MLDDIEGLLTNNRIFKQRNVDIGVVSETKSSFTKQPTITIYDNAAGGLGFSQRLYELHTTLLRAALDLVNACRCQRGCPSCVGPVAEVGEDAKGNCLRLLALLLESDLDRKPGTFPSNP